MKPDELVQPVPLGLLLIALVAAVDVALGSRAVLIPMLVVGPLVTATRGTANGTALVAIVAALLAVPLGLADNVFLESSHVIEVVVVGVAGILATLAARVREELGQSRRETDRLFRREREARRRSDVLAAAGRLLEAPPEPGRMLQEIAHIAVPSVADSCVVEVLEADGSLRSAAVAMRETPLEPTIDELRRRKPIDPTGAHPIAEAVRTGRAQLLAEVGEDELRMLAVDDEHLEMLRSLDLSSALFVPLIARGRTLGALGYVRRGDRRRYTQEDVDAAGELARRAALALDNAQLIGDLRQTEDQLEAVLQNLAEAVIVQVPSGRIVFANPIAAELMGVGGPAELVGGPSAAIVERFAIFDVRGDPLDLERTPGRQALRGETPRPLVCRRVDRETGEERWLLTKATAVVGEDGGVQLAVSVVEDVTESRRAEVEQRFLASASKLVSSSLDIDKTLEKAAWAAVPEIADWCRIDLADDRGVLHPAAAAHRDAALIEILRRWREEYPLDPADGGPYEVLRTGEPLLYESIDRERVEAYARDETHRGYIRRMDPRSGIIVPLRAGDRTIGTIQLTATGDSERRLTARDVPVMEELGRRAGIAVEHARLHAAREHIATTLQASLLPPRLPVVPGLEIAARFRAAGETTDVGGDFYDLFPTAEGWMVVMGDVTGKGPRRGGHHVAGPSHDADHRGLRAAARRAHAPPQRGAGHRSRAAAPVHRGLPAHPLHRRRRGAHPLLRRAPAAPARRARRERPLGGRDPGAAARRLRGRRVARARSRARRGGHAGPLHRRCHGRAREG